MTTDIFICSFPRDVGWLHFCLRSIRKFVTGYRNIIIAWPATAPTPSFLLPNETVHPDAATVFPGYSRHQVSKMRACQHSDADFIAFIDSDHFCLKPTDMSHFFDGDKPQLWARPYADLAVLPLNVTGVTRESCKWKKPAEHALGFETPQFTLEFLPIVHHRDVLLECLAYVEKVHGMTLEQYANSIPQPCFGDYLVMGAYALQFHADRYSIRAIRGDHDWRFAGHSPYKGLPKDIAKNFERILA